MAGIRSCEEGRSWFGELAEVRDPHWKFGWKVGKVRILVLKFNRSIKLIPLAGQVEVDSYSQGEVSIRVEWLPVGIDQLEVHRPHRIEAGLDHGRAESEGGFGSYLHGEGPIPRNHSHSVEFPPVRVPDTRLRRGDQVGVGFARELRDQLAVEGHRSVGGKLGK